VFKTNKQPPSRVERLIYDTTTGKIDGKSFSELLRGLAPAEQSQVVAGLLTAYKAVLEPLKTVH
jgi:hypothetical protein